MDHTLTTFTGVSVHAESAEIVTWQGHEALKLVNGLAVLDQTTLTDGRIEVTIGTDGPAYPGIAFRIRDHVNYELGYVQPHTSGGWDALQYDPVFHGSNTWQIYHGPDYQGGAVVPIGAWFTLRADVQGDRVALSVDDQPALIVPRLMHPVEAGYIGVWTFLPAYFRDLRVSECPALPEAARTPAELPAGLVDEWFVEGFGRATCEVNGTLNLSRVLPVALEQVTLVRQFEVAARDEVVFSFGFSDVLELRLNGDPLFTGTHTYANLNTYESRGYVRSDQHRVTRTLDPGKYTLTAAIKNTEAMSWGLSLLVQGEQVRLLPVI